MKQARDARPRLGPQIRDIMINRAKADLADPHYPDARPCDYDGSGTRNVHLQVCIWHLEENDPACAGCAYKPV